MKPVRAHLCVGAALAVALSTSGASAQELTPAPPPVTAEALLESVVTYHTAWSQGRGFLVGDRRTVVVPGFRFRGRRIRVRMASGQGEVVRATEVRATRTEIEQTDEALSGEPLLVLTLDADLPGRPLQLSSRAPALGEALWYVSTLETDDDAELSADRLDLGQTTVTAASATALSVGLSDRQRWTASPLLDDGGQVVAFLGERGRAPRAQEVLAPSALEAREPIIQPLIGLRLGTELGGFESTPLALDLELGVTLWDRLGISLRLGTTVDSSFLRDLPAEGVLGEGVAQASSSTLSLGVDLRYRFLLWSNARLPVYLDLVAGLSYTVNFVESTGQAFYATEPGCDPVGGACGVTLGEPPGRQVRHGLGTSVGLDLRLGPLVIGYRLTLAALSYDLPTTHRFTFGIAF